MYDPQLEKLIAMALQEGVISERVRSILLRKATELGVDKDELEIDLEMRLAKIKRTESSAIGIGNDNIVKATIQGGGNAPPPVPGKPIMNIGNDNVIKAEIDASTNVTHDNSVKVKGTYVAQQTVIHESGGAALIKFLTSMGGNNLDSANVFKQIDELPNNPKSLLQTLSELCRFITREIDKIYTGKNKENENSNKGLIGFRKTASDPIQDQIVFAQRILDKIHKIAFDSQDKTLAQAVSKLDEIVSRFPEHMEINKRKESRIDNVVRYTPIGYIFSFILGIYGLGEMTKGNPPGFIILIILSGLTAYGLYLYRNYVIRTEIEKLVESHQVLVIDYKYCNELVNKLKAAYQN
jgi:hypothetical protein